MKTRYVVFALIMVVASSCNRYTQLEKTPEINPATVVRADQVTNDTTSVQSMPWKSYFTDEKLQVLIGEGLEKNYNMQIALKKITEAEAAFTMAKSAVLPLVSGAARVDHTRMSTGKRGTDVFGYYSNINSLGLALSWEADIWGKLNNQTKAKYATYLNTIESRRLVQTTIVSGVATYYYNLEALDEQLRITRETIQLLQKSAETMQALKDAGQTTQAAVEQSKALLYNTQISVYTLESQIRQTENALCLLLGRAPGSIDRNNIAAQTIPATMNGDVSVRSLAYRPDVKQAELALQAAYATTNAAKASFYPTLSISSLSVGFANGEFTNFFKPAHLAAEIVLSLTQPIWAKGQLKANLKIAQAQQDEALLTFSNTMLTAGKEVSDILFTYKSSVAKNEWRSKQVQSLEKSVDYTQQLLAAGEATYTEVLTAQQSLLSAQLSRVSDKLEQLTQSINLYRALGGGVN